MLEQLEAIRERFIEVEQQIAMPEIVSDLKKFKTLSKEYKDLQKIVDQYVAYQNLLQSIEEAKTVIATEKDEDFRDMAKAELEELVPAEKEMQEVLKEMLIPKDPNDSKDCILEIRGGTGGDEASIFAGDLFRMYQRFAEKQGWAYRVPGGVYERGIIYQGKKHQDVKMSVQIKKLKYEKYPYMDTFSRYDYVTGELWNDMNKNQRTRGHILTSTQGDFSKGYDRGLVRRWGDYFGLNIPPLARDPYA